MGRDPTMPSRPSRLTHVLRPATAALALLVTLALTSVAAGSAAAIHTAGKGGTSRAVSAAAGTVGKNDLGRMTSTVKGKTSDGGTLGGSFTPLKVKKINGQRLAGANAVSGAQTAAACDILNLVLGPLDLNLLGLEVHLKQVVL